METNSSLGDEHGRDPLEPDNRWRPLASFVIEFQIGATRHDRRTVAHHVETGNEERWDGVDAEALSRWVERQLPESGWMEAEGGHSSTASATLAPRAGMRGSSPVTAVPARAITASGEQPGVVIRRVAVVQPPGNNQPREADTRSRSLGRSLERNQTFAVDVSFGRAGADPPNQTPRRRRLLVSVSVRSWGAPGSTEASRRVESRIPEAGSVCTIRTGAISLPHGTYRMTVELLTKGSTVPLDSFILPMVRVE